MYILKRVCDHCGTTISTQPVSLGTFLELCIQGSQDGSVEIVNEHEVINLEFCDECVLVPA